MTLADIMSCPPRGNHATVREGVRLGLIIATVIWLWIALVDLVVGHPFHTFGALGGIVGFTIVHFILCTVYGIVLMAVVHGTEDAPSAIFGLIFCSIIFEGAFAMLTGVLATITLGNSAWMALLGGNLIGAAVGFTLIVRTHPLAASLRRAEDER